MNDAPESIHLGDPERGQDLKIIRPDERGIVDLPEFRKDSPSQRQRVEEDDQTVIGRDWFPTVDEAAETLATGRRVKAERQEAARADAEEAEQRRVDQYLSDLREPNSDEVTAVRQLHDDQLHVTGMKRKLLAAMQQVQADRDAGRIDYQEASRRVHQVHAIAHQLAEREGDLHSRLEQARQYAGQKMSRANFAEMVRHRPELAKPEVRRSLRRFAISQGLSAAEVDSVTNPQQVIVAYDRWREATRPNAKTPDFKSGRGSGRANTVAAARAELKRTGKPADALALLAAKRGRR